jgi:Hint domain
MASPKDQGWGEDRGENHSGDDHDHGGWGGDRGGGGSGDDRGHEGGHDHDGDRDHDHGYHQDHDHHGHDHCDAPCYCRGTLIQTERGEVPVEDLAIGDMVVTISGEAKPIKWIGRRSYAGRFIADNPDVLPIVVRPGALAPEIPVRDLWLSPGHALLLDGVLVAAEHLVNGLTILQAKAVDQVEYFHLEFEAHEVILAEGAPAESYVECDNRQGFHNAHEFAELYPNDARASFSYCLPRLEAGMAELATIRACLLERAAALGHLTTADPDLHLVVDGTAVSAQSAADGRYIFRLDAAADEVWLASRSGVPAELKLLSSDRRSLGVCLERLVLRDDHLRIEISHAHPALCEGFHEDEEGARRWTTGMGRVPEGFLRAFTGGFIVEAHCLSPLPRYPLRPQVVAVPEQFAAATASPERAVRVPSQRSPMSAKRNRKVPSSRKSSRREMSVAAG